MSDIAYRLLVDLSSKGSLAPQLGKLDSQAKGLDGTFKDLGLKFSSSMIGGIERAGEKLASLAVTAAKFGAVGAVAGASFGIHLNNELEKTTISLGAIFNAQGVSKNITEGLDLAKGTIKEMRKDAAALPGEFGDLLSFFKLGATPGFQAGASVQQLERMSAAGMAAAAATGVQMDQAAREFAQLLQGRAGAHNVFGTLIGFQGDEGHKLNSMSGADRLKAIDAALQKFQPAIGAYATSFDALTSTMKDNGKQVAQKVMEPVFTRTKEILARGNKFYEDHQSQIEQWADKVGLVLLRGFDLGARKIGEWIPAIKTFGEHAAEEMKRLWEVAKPFLEGFEKLALHGLRGKGLFHGAEALAVAYGGVKLGRAGAPLFGAAKSLMGMGGGAELAGAATGIGGLATAGIATGVAAAAATVPLLAAVGAFHSITDASSDFHEEATRSAEAIAKNVSKTFENSEKVWARVGPQATSVVDFIGTTWLGGFELMSIGLEKATFGLGRFTDKVGGFLEKIGVLDGATPGPGPLDKFLARPESEHTSRFHGEDDDRKTKKGAGGGHGGTTIQKVEIVVTSNQDPSRIARFTVDRLQDVSRFPTSSARTRNWSSARP